VINEIIERIAFHEAGHVLLAIQFEIHFESAWISEKTGGGEVKMRCSPHERDYPLTDNKLGGFCMFYAAGAAAEMFINDSYDREGSSHDMRMHKLCIDRSPSLNYSWEESVKKAKSFIIFDDLKKISKRLVSNSEITFPESYEILGKKLPWD